MCSGKQALRLSFSLFACVCMRMCVCTRAYLLFYFYEVERLLKKKRVSSRRTYAFFLKFATHAHVQMELNKINE